MSTSVPRFTIWSFGRNLHTTSPFRRLEAIESTRRQTFIDWEMIVVDDASDDATWRWLANPHVHEPDARIRLIRNETRLGKMQNFINQFGFLRGEIAVELDADDWWADETALTRIDACYRTDSEIECTVGRWRMANGIECSGNVHDARERRPRGAHSYPAPRTWKTATMRAAIKRYPQAFTDPSTGQPWAASADCATIQPILHVAERVVDLGGEVYMINDHDQRDGVIARDTQYGTTARCLAMWADIRESEGLRRD